MRSKSTWKTPGLPSHAVWPDTGVAVISPEPAVTGGKAPISPAAPDTTPNFLTLRAILQNGGGNLHKVIVEMQTNGVYIIEPDRGWLKVEWIEERVRDAIVAISLDLKDQVHRTNMHRWYYPDGHPLDHFGWPADRLPDFNAIAIALTKDLAMALEIDQRQRLFPTDFVTVGGLLLTKRASTADVALEVERDGIIGKLHHNAPRRYKIDYGGGQLAHAGAPFKPLSDALDAIGKDILHGAVPEEQKYTVDALLRFGWLPEDLPPLGRKPKESNPMQRQPQSVTELPSSTSPSTASTAARQITGGSAEDPLAEQKLLLALWGLLIKKPGENANARFPNQQALVNYLGTHYKGLSRSSVFTKLAKARADVAEENSSDAAKEQPG